MKIKLSDDVKIIISQLNNFGFEAFAVGGCVRDSLLGIEPHDWDVCTNAKPEQIKECFFDYDTFDTGIKHGTISVVINNLVYEITTYRIDGEYTDNRHPENVSFTDAIEQDLARRDFTINAIAYNDDVGLVDYFNGLSDLNNKIICCVGNPNFRFNEDALRILRALRFAAVYGFDIEEKTSAAIYKNSHLLTNIAYERINVEFIKLLCGNNVEYILNKYRDVFLRFIPEIKVMFDYDQHTVHHNRDLWHHTTYALKTIESNPLLRMTMLLHDIGKPYVCTADENGTCHFKGHQRVSADIAKKILSELKFPAAFIDDCVKLIEYHDVRFNGSKKLLKKVMNKIGEENTKLLLKVQYADTVAQSEYKREEKLDFLNTAQLHFNEIINGNECFKLSQLAINGNDIKELGVSEGKIIGDILNDIIDSVIDEELENNKTALLNYVKSILQENDVCT